MTNMIRIELKRAFVNRSFFVAFLIGLMICLWHFFEYVFPFVIDSSYLSIEPENSFFPLISFNCRLGGSFVPVQSFLYFLLLPLIATLPFGNSYVTDKKTGYIKNIYTRTKRKNYIIAKYVSVFLSGAAAVVLPLLINFYLTSLVLPSVVPDSASYSSVVFSYSKWSEIFYTHPFVFELLYLFITFVFSGLIASTALIISFFINNKLIVAFAPMILYVFLSSLADISGFQSVDLMRTINPTQGYGNTVSVVIYALILFLVTWIPFYCYEVKSDTL